MTKNSFVTEVTFKYGPMFLLGCEIFRIWDGLERGMLGMWDVWDVGYSGCKMWDVQDVGCSGCGIFTMWNVWDV